MKGIFIFNDKSDLLYWVCDNIVELFIRSQLQSRNEENHEEKNHENHQDNKENKEIREDLTFDRVSINYLFLPLITMYKAYKIFANNDRFRRIQTNHICFYFSEFKRLLIITIFEPKVKNDFRNSNDYSKLALSFSHGLFADLFTNNEFKSQYRLYESLMSNVILQIQNTSLQLVEANGLINDQCTQESDNFLIAISKHLTNFWPNCCCFLTNDKQLLAVAHKGQLTKSIPLCCFDVHAILAVTYAKSRTTKFIDGRSAMGDDYIIMLADKRRKIRLPWLMIKIELYPSVFFAFITPLGMHSVFVYLQEVLAFTDKEFNSDNFLSDYLKMNNFLALLNRLEKSIKYYQNAVNLLSNLKRLITDTLENDISFDHKKSEIFFGLKIGQCKILLEKLSTTLWQYIVQEARCNKTEFFDKHWLDLTSSGVFQANLKNSLAELPPLLFDGPSPNGLHLNILCYNVQFHTRNLHINYDQRYNNVLSTLTRKPVGEKLMKNDKNLVIAKSGRFLNDYWTVTAVFEPFVNIELAWRQAVTLANRLCKLLNTQKCSFDYL